MANPSAKYRSLRNKPMRTKVLVAIFVFFLFYHTYDYILDNLYEFKLKNVDYYVNTTGCQIPVMDIMNPTIAAYVKNLDPVLCDGRTLLRTMAIGEHSYLKLNMNPISIIDYYNISSLKELNCSYCEVQRKDDFTNDCINWQRFQLQQNMLLPLSPGVNVVRVACNATAGNKTLYRDVHFVIPKPKWKPQEQHNERLSVMFVGIDAVSHLNFLRQMKQTLAYMRAKPNHVEFWGYNKVGENSAPNLFPLLTGSTPEELQKQCNYENVGFDSCDFIWNAYKSAGYNTCLAEDTSVCSTFTYNLNGFKLPPTDYFARSILVEMRTYTETPSNYDSLHCTGGRTFSQVLQEYIYKMLPIIQKNPFFSFFWFIGGTHDYFSLPKNLDKEFLQLFQKIDDSGVLNDTLLFFISDHGFNRKGFSQTEQGMRERSQPLMFILYPPWLEELYPQAVWYLQQNAYSLVTPFDVHATLKHILDLTNLTDYNINAANFESSLPRGISLFLPIPETRNCSNADIPSHYCLCHELHPVPLGDRRLQRAARFTLKWINALLQPHSICSQLAIDKLLAGYTSSQESSLMYEIRVRFQTVPGHAIFEATLRVIGYDMAFAGGISRLNSYRDQALCIKNKSIEMYCFCI